MPNVAEPGDCRTSILSELFVYIFLTLRYYQQDDKAGRLMTQTLVTLPASQRAPFSRLQASIRSAYHRSVNARKTAEFRAHLSVTTPGGSLLAHARADPRGKEAQKGDFLFL